MGHLLKDPNMEQMTHQSYELVLRYMNFTLSWHQYKHDMADEGWAWFCLEIEGWHPSSDIWSGDNLLTLMEAVTTALTNLAKRRRY